MPDGAVIESATLKLYKLYYNYEYALHPLLRNWTETGATWIQAAPGENWGTPGAQQVGVDIAETAIAQTTATWNPGWVEFNITSHVQDIAAGAANYGWRMVPGTGNSNEKRFHSSEATDTTLRPKLEIQYHTLIASTGTGSSGAGSSAAGHTQYYHYSALGTTANLTNTEGDIQISYRVDPFGAITEQQGASVNRQVFTGQEHDEQTGLIYFGARFYDPDIGRFLNQDTYLGEPGTPPSLHRYLYAYGNPTVYVDLYGNEPVDAANSFASGLVNLVMGGDIGLSDYFDIPEDLKEYARNASFGDGPIQKSYSVDFRNWSIQKQYHIGPTLGEEIASVLTFGLGETGTFLGETAGAIEVAVSEDYSKGSKDQAHGTLGNSLSVGIVVAATHKGSVIAKRKLESSLTTESRALNPSQIPDGDSVGAQRTPDAILKNGDDPYNGIKYEIVPNRKSIDLDNITPKDIPSFKSGEFNDWFDARTPEELATLYQTPGLKNKISDGLRGAGGKHEFMMVVEAPQWSKWGVKAQQVQEDFAIPISTLNEGGLAKGWKHSTGIKGSKATGSKTAHNELQSVIKNSNSLNDYKANMRVWAEKWINGGYDALPPGFHN